MKNNIVRTSLVIAALLIAAASHEALYAQDPDAPAPSIYSADRLVGAWETVVTMRNCETGEPIAPSFPGLITFNEGGTLSEFAANPGTPYRTPGHGVWEYTSGQRTIETRFSFILLTPTGVPIGRLRVEQSGELDSSGDSKSSSGTFVLTNFAGAVLATGCTSSTGERLAL